MYASLLMSLLVTFFAMVAKQWLNRYMLSSGWSLFERCGDRQRKCDGLVKWRFHFFIESLPVMLQAALLLLVCGFCQSMWSINTSVACILIGLAGLGVAFYVAIVIIGMSSYACPFQTKLFAALRRRWNRALSRIWQMCIRSVRRIRQLCNRGVQPFLRHPLLPVATAARNVQVQGAERWLKPKDLAIIHRTNADDVACVSWILRYISNPEALDAAVRLAGTIQWFGGPDINVPYDSIVSTFEACFDPAGKLYPGSRDTAYYSGRTMVWIRVLAGCKSQEFARMFPLSTTKHEETGLDPDLRHLLRINRGVVFNHFNVIELFTIDPEHTPSHAQWISDALLHYSSGNPHTLIHWGGLDLFPNVHHTNITVNVTLNHLLVWCILLGSPPAEEVLAVQNKSYDNSYFALLITHSALH